MPSLLLDKLSGFSLHTTGLLGLLGADDAISAIATAHVYGNRCLLGWYNTPGSFQIFKRLGSFVESTSPTGSPSKSVWHTDPRKLLKLNAHKGPMFRAAHSGTVMEETGYWAALFLQECATRESEERVVPGRGTQPGVRITIADLGQAPASEMRPAFISAFTIFFASLLISVSVVTCVLCAVYADWLASFSILVGIVTSGLFCLVLGSADFVFKHNVPAKGSPPGDGILGSDKDMVLLKGEEGAVNAITRGEFSLRFPSQSHYNLIQQRSLLFLVQYFMQLLLIPQASLFGQTMFLTSFGVSALYNTWLSSDKEKVHQKFLFEQVLENPRLTKYTLATRTAAVVFALLVLQPQDQRGLLDELLPDNTEQRGETILERLRYHNDKSLNGKVAGHLDGLRQQGRDLLASHDEDVQAAYDVYKEYLQVTRPNLSV